MTRSLHAPDPDRTAARPRLHPYARGAPGGLRARRFSGLQVVLYHHVSEEPSPLVDRLRVSTPPAVFEAHVARLARDYEVVDLDQVLSGNLPRKALLITFDDGYRSVLDVAAPILARHGLPSVFFVSAAHVTPGSLPLDNVLCWLSHRIPPQELHEVVAGIPTASSSFAAVMAQVAALDYGRRSRLCDELAEHFAVDREALRRESGLFLESCDLRDLPALGVELGNHTRSHLHCRCVRDDDAVEAELVGFRRQLEEWTATAVRSFSYPYGNRRDATPLVERALADSGHEARFLVESRPNRRAGHSLLNRVSLGDTSTSRLSVELEVLPRLRALRDRLR